MSHLSPLALFLFPSQLSPNHPLPAPQHLPLLRTQSMDHQGGSEQSTSKTVETPASPKLQRAEYHKGWRGQKVLEAILFLERNQVIAVNSTPPPLLCAKNCSMHLNVR